MADQQVNYSALDAAAADIRSGSSNLQSCIDDLESTLNRLRASWEGAAQEAYDAAQVKWNEGLDGLKDVLDRTSNACRYCELQLSTDGPGQRQPFLISNTPAPRAR